jgi:UDP-N-acetylglucosamine 2-epimerase (non-hydrolysing)
MHANPVGRQSLARYLVGFTNVVLCEPLSYDDMARALDSCSLVLTDSGRIQEEAPTFGKPLLVMRDVTERQGVLEQGCARLVGTDPRRIVDEATALLDDELHCSSMSSRVSPYGDGRAAERIASAIVSVYVGGVQPAEFCFDRSKGWEP